MWRFGDYEVDPPQRELRRRGEVVHLEPQAFDLLVQLLEQRDRVVPKGDLLDGVWGHHFLSEANLTTRVKEVRRAVGDDGRTQHTIRNVRGHGYRFIANVAELDPTSARAGRGDLIGREAEITTVREALHRSRVVTLVGPGGVGKSALARTIVAAGITTGRPDGIHVVGLASLEDPSAVVPAVARALDVVLDPERVDDTVHGLAHLDALVVLDDCERTIDEVAVLVEAMLDVAGGAVGVLATSQVPLGISQESIVELGPLAPTAARRLFDARARAALLAWDGVDDERIQRLVDALDRMPLTIEMVAARIRTMTFDDLERVFIETDGLLRVAHRTTTARHRSLDALARWSADLLNPRRRRVLTEFAVFAGPVGVVAAGAVLAPDDPASIALDLAALAERSLLVADVAGTDARYSMLSTVRTAASRWLAESHVADEVRGRHAEHLAEVLLHADSLLRTPREVVGRDLLDEVADEVRVAYRWAQTHRPELASQMSGSLFHAAYSSLWHEPAEWGLPLIGASDVATRARPTLLVAGVAAHRGDLDVARRLCEPLTSLPDARLRASAWELLADVALYQGDLATAGAAGQELARLGGELDDLHARVLGLVDATLARAYGGDPSGALRDIARAPWEELAPTDAAWLAYVRGEVLGMLGDDDAAEAISQAIALGATVGNRFVVSVAQVSLADQHARTGAVEESFDAYASALRDFARHGNTTHAFTAIRNLVELLATIGDDRGAATLAGCASDTRRRASYGAEAERVRRVLDAVRTRVGHDRLAGWMADGLAGSGDPVRLATRIVAEHQARR